MKSRSLARKVVEKEPEDIHPLDAVSGSPVEDQSGGPAVGDGRSGDMQTLTRRGNFEQFFAYSAAYCYLVSADGVIIDVNNAMLGAMDCTEQELAGKPVAAIYAPESQAKLEKLWAWVEKTGQIHSEEMIILTKRGQRRTVLLNVGAVRDENGKIKYCTCVQTDITARTHATQALKKSEDRYPMSFRSRVPAVCIIRLKDGCLRDVNTAFEDVTGYQRAEVIGHTAIELGLFDNPKDEDRLVRELRARGTIRDLEMRFRARDGTLLVLNLSAELIELDGEPFVLGVYVDQSGDKRAEETLRKLSPAIERGLASIIITDTTGAIEYVNHTFTELTGYSASEVLGQNPRLLKSGLTSYEEYKSLWNSISSGYEWRGLFCNKKKNGDLYWETASIFPILNRQGKITNYVSLQEDVTENKRVDAALHRSKERFRRLFENSPLGLYRATARGEILDINLAACRILGYERAEELIGHTADEFWKNADMSKLDSLLPNADGVLDFEAQIRRHDDQVIWARIRGRTVFDPESHELFVEGSLEDITERTRGEDALRESEARLAGVISSAMDAIISADSEQRIVMFNTAAERMFRCSAHEVIGKPLERFVPERFHVVHQRHLRSFGEAGVTTRSMRVLRPLNAVRADGEEFPIEASISQVMVSGQKLLTVILRDITEQQRAKQALEEAEYKYRSLVEQVPIVTYIASLDHKSIYVSPQVEKFTGYTPAECLADTNLWVKSLHPEDCQRVLDEHAKALGLTGKYATEYRLVAKDGRIVWIRDEGRVLQSSADSPAVLQGIWQDITERKHAEISLAASEAELRTLFASMQDIVLVIDHNGVYRKIAPTNPALLYKPAEELLGKTLQDVFPPEQAESFLGVVQKVLDTRQTAQIEYKLTIGGRPLWFSAFITRLTEDATVWVARDITERKRAEDNLLQQLAFDELLTSISTGLASRSASEIDDQIQTSLPEIGAFFGADSAFIVLATPDLGTWSMPYHWIARDWQEGAGNYEGLPTEIFPWSKKMLLDGKVIKIDTLDDLPSDAAAERELYERQGMQSALEVPFYGQGGLINGCLGLGSYSRRVQWSPDDVRRLGVVSQGIATVFDRKRAEDESRRRAQELELLTKMSAAMRIAQSRSEIIQVVLQQLFELLTAEGAAIFMNDFDTGEMVFELGCREWEHWTGMRLVPGEGISGKVISTDQPYRNNHAREDLFAIDPKLFGDLTCVACVPLIANELTIGGLWIGRRTPISVGDTHLLTAIAELAANAIHRQTLTEDLRIQLQTLQQIQNQLLQSEKLAAIGELVSGVAHELNNPLTSVVLYSQLVQQEELGEATKNNLSKVTAEALRAAGIVRGLLDFSRQRPVQHDVVSVNDVVKNSMELLTYELSSHNIKSKTELSPNLPLIVADPHQLQQVFVNLIQNAWQAMDAAHGGGCLTIRTETDSSQYSAPSSDKSKVVRICFEDDGPGIPDEILSRIFDPFFTTKPEGSGTGLGLSICHGIIAEHGGHIWAETGARQGAKFVVELPVSSVDESVAAKPVDRQTLASPTKNSRILVLDDEPNIQSVLAQSLQSRGYAVDIASNGLDGLAYLSRASYDVILCDIRMPGINGVDFYRQVQAKDNSIAKKIIFITGDVANKMTRDFIEENHVTCLRKPFELADLLQVVQLAVEK